MTLLRYLFFTLVLSTHSLFASTNTCVAYFPNNDASLAKEGNKIFDALRRANMEFRSADGREVCVNVFSSDEFQARYIIAHLILSNKTLQITLTKTIPPGNKWIAISPEQALREYKPKTAEQGVAATP